MDDIKLQEYIKKLRDEATQAKSCFTQYSFQSLVIASAILSFIFSNIKDNPVSSVAVLSSIILLIIMCWIGIYKYTAASRAYGCQLYFEKVTTFFCKIDKDKIDENTEIIENREALELIINNNHWEQVFRVLRVVESTIFNAIYISPYVKSLEDKEEKIKKNIFLAFISLVIGSLIGFVVYIFFDVDIKIGYIFFSIISVCIYSAFKLGLYRILYRFDFNIFQLNKVTHNKINSYRIDFDNRAKIGYPWFMTREIFQFNKDDSNKLRPVYYAGTYLKNMLRLLLIMQIISLSPLAIVGINALSDLAENIRKNNIDPFICLKLNPDIRSQSLFVLMISTILFSTILFIYSQFVQINRRREIIDNELHSISSFSEIWHIVSIVHYRAYKEAIGKINKNDSYTYDGNIYMEKVVEEIDDFAQDIFQIQKWFRPVKTISLANEKIGQDS